MVIKKEDRVNLQKPNLRGGEGTLLMGNALLEPDLPSNFKLVAEFTIDPGCSIGKHDHTGNTELYFITDGEFTVYDNDEKVTMRTGDIMFTGNGGTHSIKNEGTKPCKVLGVIVND